MPSARRYEVARELVEEEKNKRGGCVHCGKMADDMLFKREEGYPDRHMIEKLVTLGLSKHRIIAALPFTTLWCRECFIEESREGGSLYRKSDITYRRCDREGCSKKARKESRGEMYCNAHYIEVETERGN